MILTQKQLAPALRTTVHTVKLLDAAGKNLVGVLSAGEATILLKRGGYEAGGNTRRVRYLRPVRDPRLFPVPALHSDGWHSEDDYWAGRSVIKFHGNRRSSVGKLIAV